MSDGYIRIKPGVDMSGLAPEIWRAAERIAPVFERYGLPAVITSARRPIARPRSYHHIGWALDWRARHIRTRDAQLKILAEIKGALGPDYDVILHGEGADIHYHVEYDPY